MWHEQLHYSKTGGIIVYIGCCIQCCVILCYKVATIHTHYVAGGCMYIITSTIVMSHYHGYHFLIADVLGATVPGHFRGENDKGVYKLS